MQQHIPCLLPCTPWQQQMPAIKAVSSPYAALCAPPVDQHAGAGILQVAARVAVLEGGAASKDAGWAADSSRWARAWSSDRMSAQPAAASTVSQTRFCHTPQTCVKMTGAPAARQAAASGLRRRTSRSAMPSRKCSCTHAVGKPELCMCVDLSARDP